MNNQEIILNSGHKMPIVGLGTWKSEPGKVGAAIEYALVKAGYRHIDCAAIYKNEPEIGAAFNKVFSSGQVKREDVFITSKLWNTMHAKDDVEIACRQTLKDLQLDYLDLYLIHWGLATPKELGAEPLDKDGFLVSAKISIQETWQAMEKLIEKGLVKSIGVSNFTGPMLIDLMSYAKIVPAVNQVELHPYNQQNKLLEYAKHLGIALTAYSPLGSPSNAKARQEKEPILLEDAVVLEIAKIHNKSAAQVLIRWAIQRGTIVIPKSVTPENIKNNFAVLDFELSDDDLNKLSALDRKHRFVHPWDWYKIPYFE